MLPPPSSAQSIYICQESTQKETKENNKSRKAYKDIKKKTTLRPISCISGGFRANTSGILGVLGLTVFWKINAGNAVQSWQSDSEL